MVPEVVAVHTRGVERWLSQRLSTRLGTSEGRADGVCANVLFPFPGRVLAEALAAASGITRGEDPWAAERAAWPLLEVVDHHLDEPWLATLATHLGGGDEERRHRRFSTVRHVAGLFERYAVHRPDMLAAWAEGGDTDGSGTPLPEEHRWQAELWRRLRARIGTPSPAERLPDACSALRADPGLADPLPSRFSLFGLTRLPASQLALLDALAAGRDVHLFLLHPSPALWERVAERAVGLGPGRVGPVRRVDDPTVDAARHPLLVSWGRDTREMQLVLTAGADAETDALAGPPPDGDGAEPKLLARLQADIRADRPPPGEPLPGAADDARAVLDPGDRSVAVHSCHGRARQVEVVRDAVLHLLAEDPTLEPRDVIVMCPDIEAFAPLIHATFGTTPDDEPAAERADGVPPELHVRLADRSLRQTNPVLGVIGSLVDLASARLTAAQVLDLAGREPVRRRFRFDDDDLARMEEWVTDTGVRWGLDADHRSPFQLQAVSANTWREGLDRILLGVAMADEGQRLVGGKLPLDDVGSGDIDLAGRFAEFVARLDAAVRSLQGVQPVAAWAAALSLAVDALCATTVRDSWQRAQAQRILEDVLGEATPGEGAQPSGAPLSLVEVRALLADRLRGRPTRANFRTGHLTVCTLVPMRSVPHRVVCLLGLDDGSFPRRTVVDGDDLVSRDPCVGDRDVRSEERQLLLDALMAASEHLVVTYAGRDERTNAVRPPAVPVGELLDVIDRTVRGPDGRPARDQIVVHHPLQPFDRRNFTGGELVPGKPWSFDRVSLAGAAAMTGPRLEPPPFLTDRLPVPGADEAGLELETLVRFVGHPVKAFLRQRLGVSLTEAPEDAPAALPVELDGLERWQVGQRLLEGLLGGAALDACVAAERARGSLPPGALADGVLGRVTPVVERLAREATALRGGSGGEVLPSTSVDIYLPLPDGRLLIGTVPDMVEERMVSVTYSSVAPKHRLAAWVRFLAVTAAWPDRPVSAATVGRNRFGAPRGTRITTVHLRPLGPDPETRRQVALSHLSAIVDLYDRGMREPLPLFTKTSHAWAEAAAARRQPDSAAAKAWESTYDRAGEDAEPEHQLVLGGRVPFAAVLAIDPAKDEEGDGWDPMETTRFGRLARRLWDALLDAEDVVDS
jgi:exodeoxyribonuclease V gamma subunit